MRELAIALERRLAADSLHKATVITIKRDHLAKDRSNKDCVYFTYTRAGIIGIDKNVYYTETAELVLDMYGYKGLKIDCLIDYTYNPDVWSDSVADKIVADLPDTDLTNLIPRKSIYGYIKKRARYCYAYLNKTARSIFK